MHNVELISLNLRESNAVLSCFSHVLILNRAMRIVKLIKIDFLAVVCDELEKEAEKDVK